MMNTSSYCACRTAALRIFVRSLVGPVPATSSRSTASRATTTAAGQWRSLLTTGRPSILRFEPITNDVKTTRALHASRQLFNDAQLAEQSAATSSENDGPSAEDTNPKAEAPAMDSDVAPTTPPYAVVQPIQDVVGEAEHQHSRPPEKPLGKNAKKRLRRRKEAAKLAEEAAAAVAGVEAGTVDPAEAERLVNKLKPKKEKKAKKEKKEKEPKKNKLEKMIEAREAKRKAKKDKRRERRAAEKAAAKQAAVIAASSPASKSKIAEAVAAGTSSKNKITPLPKNPEQWQVQKRALREKFPGGWNPRKKLSPDALEGIRALNRQFPQVYTTSALAAHFEVSPEAIRRILKSKWQAKPEEEEDRQNRWFERGKRVWSRWAELGRKPPKRWQAEGILRDPMSWSGGRKRMMQRRAEMGSGAAGAGTGMSRGRQIMRQNRENRRNFQASLHDEGVNSRGGGAREYPSADAMRKAIDGSSDVDAPTRSVQFTPEQGGTARSASQGRGRRMNPYRMERLRRHGKADPRATKE